MATFKAQVMPVAPILAGVTNWGGTYSNRWTGNGLVETIGETGVRSADFVRNNSKSVRTPRKFGACVMSPTPADDFFDQIITLPPRIDAGFVLALQTHTITVYNAWRNATRSWDAFTNNAGAGVAITNLPALPTSLPPQSGLSLNLQIETEGPATINGTLDFDYDTEDDQVIVRGTRSIVFPFEPQAPVTEVLRNRSNVMKKRNGTEQRTSLRHAPRQLFDLTFRPSDFERQAMQNLLMEAQARPLGLPIWTEPAHLTTAAAINDTSVAVDSTAFADFRVGGSAFIYQDDRNFEVVEISAVNPTSIDLAVGLTKAFNLKTRVMPIRVAAHITSAVRAQKFIVGLEEFNARFQIIDNDVDLADTSAFPVFDSRVILSEPNMVSERAPQTYQRKLKQLDNETGLFTLTTDENFSQRRSTKTFFSNTRERLWEVRQLVHALRGQQKSFYIPTFFPDFTATLALGSGSSTLRFENVGFHRFVDGQLPWGAVMVRRNDGGPDITRTITATAEVDDLVEEITVDSPWGVAVGLDAIDFIAILEKVRMDGEDVTFEHRVGAGHAKITMPVVGVLE